MTWGEFNALVRIYLPNHNNRLGIQNLVDQLIRSGCVDLQNAVPSYMSGHLTEYGPDELREDGFASVGLMPPGVITAAKAAARDETTEVVDYANMLTVRQVPWEKTLAMRKGEVDGQEAWIAVNTQTGMFMLTPKVDDSFRLVLEWSGVRSDFGTADRVKFGELAAQAVAEYVLARVTRLVDRDLNIASSHEKTFIQLKRRLRSEEHAKGFVGRQ